MTRDAPGGYRGIGQRRPAEARQQPFRLRRRTIARRHGVRGPPELDASTMTWLLTLLGFALLLTGGEIVVRAAVRLAARLRISPLVVGITVVGFGTALPELAVSIDAALTGSPGLAVGNVIGSNVANAMLILGVAAVICPVLVEPRALRREALALVGATVAFVAVGLSTRRVEWWHGAFMVAALGGYMLAAIRQAGRATRTADVQVPDSLSGTASLRPPSLLLVVGLAAVLVGAECLVRGAVRMATQFGVPDEVIGLTLVAVGTSLPEIATGFAAAWRGRTELCLGNVIGSNLFNILGIAGATALVSPLPFSGRIIGYDLWVLFGTTAVLILLMVTRRRVGRLTGVVLAATYAAYLVSQFPGGPSPNL